jgi:hypothetical protein
VGPRMHQLLIISCVASSLSLFACDNSKPTGGLCLPTVSCCSSTAIVGPVLDTFTMSHDVAGTMHEELERHVNMGLLCL